MLKKKRLSALKKKNQNWPRKVTKKKMVCTGCRANSGLSAPNPSTGGALHTLAN